MARDRKKADSVYDFLYVDSRRIALFNSQFSEFGHLTTLTRSATESKTTGGTVGGSLKVVSANLNTSDAAQSALSRQFDTQWVAPLTFLDSAQHLIVRGATNARIGQLVLASGKLELRDLNIIKQMVVLPSMKKLRQDQPKEGGHRDKRRPTPRPAEGMDAVNDFGLEFLTSLPHALHGNLEEPEGASIWCSLRDDCLLVAATDLFLKHGVSISGTWNIVGVLDALPEISEPATSAEAAKEMADAQASIPKDDFDSALIMVTKGFGGYIDSMAPFVQMILGRPSRSFGVTPLLIFREVG